MTEEEIIERILAIQLPIRKYTDITIPNTHYTFYVTNTFITIFQPPNISQDMGFKYIPIPPELEEYFTLKDL